MITDFTTIRYSAEVELSNNYTETPIHFENVGLPEGLREYIALRDQASPSQQLSLGDDAKILSGVMLIDIFTAVGTGTERARVIANALDTALGNKTVSGVAYESPSLHTVGQTKDSSYYHHVLQIPYQIISGQIITVC